MSHGVPLELDQALVRYDVRLMRDVATQAELRRNGFAVRGPVLDDYQIRDLLSLSDEFLERLHEPWGDAFLPIGRIEDYALRREMIERAGALVRPVLQPHVVDGGQVFGSALLIKPPSPTSGLSPHQDSSLVDERTVPGVYAWIPLVDTDGINGGMRVVPGSHRITNLHRTLNVPWQFAGAENLLDDLSVQLTVPAGWVVLFDSAMIHGSHPNVGDSTRPALNSFLRPGGAPLLHFYIDELTQPDQVEVFQVDETFYLSDNIMVRPGPPHRGMGTVPHHHIDFEMAQFERLCHQAISDSGVPGDRPEGGMSIYGARPIFTPSVRPVSGSSSVGASVHSAPQKRTMRSRPPRITFAGWQLAEYGGLETRITAAVDLASNSGYNVSVRTVRPTPPGSPTEQRLRTHDSRSVISDWERQPAVRLDRLARRVAVSLRQQRLLTASEAAQLGHRHAMAHVDRYWTTHGAELLRQTDILHLFGPPLPFVVSSLQAAHHAGVPTLYQSVHAVTAEYASNSWRSGFIGTCNDLDLILVTQQRQVADFRQHFGYLGRTVEVGQWAYEIEDDLLCIDRPGSSSGRDDDNRPVIVGTLARLDPVKGIDQLIRAFAMVQCRDDTVLRIGGDGDQLHSLRELALELGLDGRVEFAGHVTNRATFYEGLDIFVIASSSEGGPVTGVEAMAAGLPIVSTRAGAMPERLDGGVGVLVDSNDPADLCSPLMELCNDRDRRRALGRAGRARYIERYSAALHSERLLSVWAQMAEYPRRSI